jgi:hypothetical protein
MQVKNIFAKFSISVFDIVLLKEREAQCYEPALFIWNFKRLKISAHTLVQGCQTGGPGGNFFVAHNALK